MEFFKKLFSFFRKKKEPTKPPQIQLVPYEVAEPGSKTKWAVDVLVNGHLKVTKWFPKKPTKRQLKELSSHHN